MVGAEGGLIDLEGPLIKGLGVGGGGRKFSVLRLQDSGEEGGYFLLPLVLLDPVEGDEFFGQFEA